MVARLVSVNSNNTNEFRKLPRAEGQLIASAEHQHATRLESIADHVDVALHDVDRTLLVLARQRYRGIGRQDGIRIEQRRGDCDG